MLRIRLMPRLRDKLDAQLRATLYGFLLALAAGLLAEYAGYEGQHTMVLVVGFAVGAGLLARWGWELRRWYRKTRPGYDPLAQLRERL